MDYSELPKCVDDCNGRQHNPARCQFGACPIIQVPATLEVCCCGWFKNQTVPPPFPEYRENMETAISDVLESPGRICITRLPDGAHGHGGPSEFHADYFDAHGKPSENVYGGDTWQEAFASLAAALKGANDDSL